MTAAVSLSRYFVGLSVVTWEGCATEPLGARVVRWLEKERRASVTQRDVQRAFSRAFRKAVEVRGMLVELAERGYLAPTDDPATWLVSPRQYGAGEGNKQAARWLHVNVRARRLSRSLGRGQPSRSNRRDRRANG
jgi:hypothetical protein